MQNRCKKLERKRVFFRNIHISSQKNDIQHLKIINSILIVLNIPCIHANN